MEKTHVLFDTVFEKMEDIFAPVQLLLEAQIQVEGILLRTASEERQERRRKVSGLLGNRVCPEECMQEYSVEEEEKAADFILRKAEECRAASKLYLCVYGGLDHVYEALRRQPELAKRLIVIWMGDFEHCFEKDTEKKAPDLLFTSELELWHVPPAVYKQIRYSNAQLELRMKPLGNLGTYLVEQIKREQNGPGSVNCGGMAGVLLLMTSGFGRYELTVYQGKEEKRGNPRRRCVIREYSEVDNRMVLEDFLAKLALFQKGLLPRE